MKKNKNILLSKEELDSKINNNEIVSNIRVLSKVINFNIHVLLQLKKLKNFPKKIKYSNGKDYPKTYWITKEIVKWMEDNAEEVLLIKNKFNTNMQLKYTIPKSKQVKVDESQYDQLLKLRTQKLMLDVELLNIELQKAKNNLVNIDDLYLLSQNFSNIVLSTINNIVNKNINTTNDNNIIKIYKNIESELINRINSKLNDVKNNIEYKKANIDIDKVDRINEKMSNIENNINLVK